MDVHTDAPRSVEEGDYAGNLWQQAVVAKVAEVAEVALVVVGEVGEVQVVGGVATSDTVADGYKMYQDDLKMLVLLELLLPLIRIVVDRSLCSAQIDGCCILHVARCRGSARSLST